MVAEAMKRGLPASIHRLDRIAGHSVTGACQTDDFFWRMIRTCIDLKAAPEMISPMSLVPADFVAGAVVHAIMNHDAWTPKTLHFSNPATIDWNEVVDWMIACGYQLRRVSFADWKQLVVERTRSGRLAAAADLVPLLMGATSGDGKTAKGQIRVGMSNTLRVLANSDLVCSPITPTMLERYFRFFWATGFLAKPQETARVPADEWEYRPAFANGGRE